MMIPLIAQFGPANSLLSKTEAAALPEGGGAFTELFERVAGDFLKLPVSDLSMTAFILPVQSSERPIEFGAPLTAQFAESWSENALIAADSLGMSALPSQQDDPAKDTNLCAAELGRGDQSDGGTFHEKFEPNGQDIPPLVPPLSLPVLGVAQTAQDQATATVAEIEACSPSLHKSRLSVSEALVDQPAPDTDERQFLGALQEAPRHSDPKVRPEISHLDAARTPSDTLTRHAQPDTALAANELRAVNAAIHAAERAETSLPAAAVSTPKPSPNQELGARAIPFFSQASVPIQAAVSKSHPKPEFLVASDQAGLSVEAPVSAAIGRQVQLPEKNAPAGFSKDYEVVLAGTRHIGQPAEPAREHSVAAFHRIAAALVSQKIGVKDLSLELSPQVETIPDAFAAPQLSLAETGSAVLAQPGVSPQIQGEPKPASQPLALPMSAAQGSLVPALMERVNESDPSTAVEIALAPEELGRLRMTLISDGDHVRVHLVAERPETLDLMRRHADQLAQEFRQSGFAGASLSFGHWGGGSEATPHQVPPTMEDRPLLDVAAPPVQRLPGANQYVTGLGLDMRL